MLFKSKIFFTLMMFIIATHTVCSNSYDKICIYEEISSQNCRPNPDFSQSTSITYLNKFPQIEVPLVFWGINKDDGSSNNPLTKDKIQESIYLLNDAFEQMNICFYFEAFHTINATEIYWTDYYAFNRFIKKHKLSNDKALNIYTPYRFTNYRNNLRGGKWSWNQLSVNMLNYNTGILPHEVGHIFGLSHTHSGASASNCERVTRDKNNPDYNAHCAGDRVTDTSAMPNLYSHFNFITEDCTYIGDLKDCNGTLYELSEKDIRNFMGYTQHVCRSTFTVGQGVRVREFINKHQKLKKFPFLSI